MRWLVQRRPKPRYAARIASFATGSDGGGKLPDAQLLAKLKAILVGNRDSHPYASSNSGLMARLRRILGGHRQSESTGATISLGPVVHSLAQQGKIDEARKLCSEMARRRCVPDIVVLSAFPAARLKGEACLFELPRGWSSQPLSPHSSVIKLLCKTGKFEEAFKGAVAMLRQGLVVESLVLNTLVYGLYKAGRSSQCLTLLMEMVSSGDTPDVVGAGEDCIHRVCGAFDDLLEHSVCPDVMFYTTLVDGLCIVGRIDEAYFIYRNSATRHDYSVSTCNVLIQSLIERDRGKEVFPLALAMLKNGFTVKSSILNSLIGRFCEAGKDDMVLNAFYSPSKSSLDHKSMLAGLCGLGKVEEASRFFVDMVEKGDIADTESLDSLLMELCKAVLEKPECHKSYEGIVRTTTSCKFSSSTTYRILVEYLIKANMTEEVRKLVMRMLDRNFVPESDSYSVLIVKLCQEKRIDDALVVLKKATCPVSSTASNAILQGLCRGGGSVNVALELVNWMRTKDQAPDSVSSNDLIDRLLKEKKTEEAFSLYYDKMVPRGFNMDKTSYDAILGGLWDSGKETQAFQLFQQMVRNGVAPDATTSTILIAGLCKSDKVDAALKIVKILPTMGVVPHLNSYNTLLGSLCSRGDSQSVKNLLEDMSNSGRDLDLVSYNTTFLCFSKSGWQPEIRKLFLQMLDKGCEPVDQTYEIVFSSLCSAQDIDGAWDAIQGIIKAGLPLKKHAYRPYLVALLKAGKVEEAKECFKDTIGYPDSTTLLDCFLEAGLVREACDFYDKALARQESAVLELLCGQSGEKMAVVCKFVNELHSRKSQENLSVENLVSELLGLKKLDLAAEVVKQGMTLGCIRPSASSSTVRRVADGLLEERKMEELCEIFDVVAALDGCEINLPRKYIRRLLSRGEIDAANKILETTLIPKKKKSYALYDMVIGDFCKLGRFQEGARILEHLHGNGILPRVSDL